MSFIERMSRDDLPDSGLSGRELWKTVIDRGRCSGGGVDPDQWYPVSGSASAARLEAAGAIAVCAGCPVRTHCLELALRYWTVGQHGVWGGTVPAERTELHRAFLRRQGARDAAAGTCAAS